MPKMPTRKPRKEPNTHGAGASRDERCPVCDMRPCGCPTF